VRFVYTEGLSEKGGLSMILNFRHGRSVATKAITSEARRSGITLKIIKSALESNSFVILYDSILGRPGVMVKAIVLPF